MSNEQNELHGDRIFVDAKILGRDDRTKPKRTFVAYVVKDRADLQGFTEIIETGADETDEAELHAIAFAIRSLIQVLPGFIVMSDNQSAVDVTNRVADETNRAKTVLAEILEQKRAHRLIQVEWYEKNPAHRVLNAHVLELQKREQALQAISKPASRLP